MPWQNMRLFKYAYHNSKKPLSLVSHYLSIKSLYSMADWSAASKTMLVSGLIWPFHVIFYFISTNLLSADMFDTAILSLTLLVWLGIISFIFCVSSFLYLNGSTSRFPIYLLIIGYGMGMFVFVYLFGTMGNPYVAYYITSVLVVLVVYDSRAGIFALFFVIIINIALVVGESKGYLPHAPAINNHSIDVFHNSAWVITSSIWCIMTLVFIYYLVHLLVISRDHVIHQLRHTQSEIEHLSRVDALTSVANRRYFDERLSNAISHAKYTQEPLTLIFCDADYFKSINDHFGHHVGDKVLKALAALLKQHTPSIGFVARFGGEEFVILLPNITSQTALDIAEKLRRHITELKTIPTTINITASFGVASWLNGDDANTLLQKADLALYQAKDTGRNKVCLYQSDKIALAS